jgi:hypothetical protein
MQISAAVLALSLALAGSTHGISIKGSGDKVLRLPIRRAARPDPVISKIQHEKRLDKRASYTASLYNDMGSQYIIDVNIGTPAQNFSVSLDTGR